MAVFRVPYPEDPERRATIFQKLSHMLERHGRYEGTAEQGTFEGSTPIGRFAGTYRAIGPDEIEIELTKKPWLVSEHRVESEVRKFLAQG